MDYRAVFIFPTIRRLFGGLVMVVVAVLLACASILLLLSLIQAGSGFLIGTAHAVVIVESEGRAS